MRVVATENILIRTIAEDMQSLVEDYEVRNVFAIDQWQLLFDPADHNIKKVDIEQAKRVLMPQQLFDYAGDISRMRFMLLRQAIAANEKETTLKVASLAMSNAVTRYADKSRYNTK